MLESVDKDWKTALMSVETKENMLIIKKIRNLKTERGTFRKNQMEILELRNMR